jgi:uncharacterized protein YfaS (alpha-2-macroglobulin family)
MVMSDRGVYRPGSTVFIKGMLRKLSGAELLPVEMSAVRMRVVSPTGKDETVTRGITDAMGTLAGRWEAPAGAEIGRWEIHFEKLDGSGGPLASTMVQVAEFEPPRFAVDVEAEHSGGKLVGAVKGRYLFGAAMDGAQATWTLRRSQAPMPAGALVGRGFVFRDEPDYYDEYGEGSGGGDDAWVRTGEGKLDAKGLLAVEQSIELSKGAGPQRFVLEAEVTDESHRAIAGRGDVVVHEAKRYAGVRLEDSWVAVGTALPIELGVIDQSGDTVTGVPVEARLERISYEMTRRPGPGGSTRVDWQRKREKVASCTAKSTDTGARCELVPKQSGDYEVIVSADGRDGGTVGLWAWRAGGSETRSAPPGRRVSLQTDAKSYAPGQTAKIQVRNPFAAAHAIVTVEAAGVLHHEVERITDAQATFEVPIDGAMAPHAYATVTLLPIDAPAEGRADWKFGAVKLPVGLDVARLDLSVASDRPHYEPGEEIEITIDVARGGKPVANADVVLAVVDEGVLRLTDFHAPDPLKALRPGVALQLSIADTRQALAALLERSHVAGDGGSAGGQSLVETRKDFVQTLLWEPSLRTDAAGKAKVKVKLADNLTRFRMMAVALDDKGRGAVREEGFEVRKPLMAIPAVPRFALLGDAFEAAALVHNGTDSAMTATVVLGERERQVEIAALGRARVSFDMVATELGERELLFSVRDGSGTERDRVLVKVPVRAPGLDEHPRLTAGFVGKQDIRLEVPDDVWPSDPEIDHLVLTLGHDLWPELGARLEYLIEYPHGCVEQTTSGTLPMLAAREILPRLGLTRWSRQDIDARIEAGIDRLATMRTGSGGLGYWPGDGEPNLYGTAYAMRAVARAKAAGLEVPEGMLEGMRSWLETQLLAGTGSEIGQQELRASVALALAESGGLSPAVTDALWDGVGKQGVFGMASLAIAFSTVAGQEDRVKELLDKIEGSFDAQGRLTVAGPSDHFLYYGSDSRSRAQAALALQRLRPVATVLPALVDRIAREGEGYTTQATAFGLLALAERITTSDSNPLEATVTLDGQALVPDVIGSLKLGGARRYEIPLDRVRGKKMVLRLETASEQAVAFMLDGRWRRPFSSAGSLAATSGDGGPEVWRFWSDPTGEPIELDAITPGQLVRVAVLARMPVESLERGRLGYLAMTDRIPAGFEPVQPELHTVAAAPELEREHPLHDLLQYGQAEASHVELHDDRVQLYFDRVWSDYVAATYLVRATTPGSYAVPPTEAELMYEADGVGYGDSVAVTVLP